MIDGFRDDLGLTHFTSIRKSAVEVDKAVNQSLEGRVRSRGSGVCRIRKGVRRLGCHGREKPCKDFPTGVPFPPCCGEVSEKGLSKQLKESRPSEIRSVYTSTSRSWLRRVHSRTQRLNFDAS